MTASNGAIRQYAEDAFAWVAVAVLAPACPWPRARQDSAVPPLRGKTSGRKVRLHRQIVPDMEFRVAAEHVVDIDQAPSIRAARCYLDPVRKRRNLHIQTEALTEGLCSVASAAPVRYSVGGAVREARAAREVVVSAGTINSPQLLELSSIGQPERLRNLGIEVRRHAMPGVGENLRDHYVPRTRCLIGEKGITFNDRGRGPPSSA